MVLVPRNGNGEFSRRDLVRLGMDGGPLQVGGQLAVSRCKRRDCPRLNNIMSFQDGPEPYQTLCRERVTKAALIDSPAPRARAPLPPSPRPPPSRFPHPLHFASLSCPLASGRRDLCRRLGHRTGHPCSFMAQSAATVTPPVRVLIAGPSTQTSCNHPRLTLRHNPHVPHRSHMFDKALAELRGSRHGAPCRRGFWHF